jgi:hypothetical protein
MSTPLAEAIAGLNLQPGQTYRTTVADYEVEVRRRVEREAPVSPATPPAVDSPPEEERSQFEDMVMLDPWVDLGAVPSPKSITVTVRVGEPIWPSPIIIDDSDLAPE